MGGLLFSSFAVAPTPEAQIALQAANPVDATLTFALVKAPAAPPFDVILTYTVTGGLYGIDAGIGTATGNIFVIENAFSGMTPTGGSGLLAAITATPGAPADAWFTGGAVSPVYISKDIKVTTGEISDFSNSHHTPEPMSFVLMGTGLLGLGLIRRVRK